MITQEQKDKYLEHIYEEMSRRGFTEDEIPVVINKTGFMAALNEYPEVQLHYSISHAVDEILLVAAVK